MRNVATKFLIIFLALFFSLMASFVFADEAYKVGVSDVLDVRVIDHPELSISVIVSSDGDITFPYIGSLHVKGLTIMEIKEKITKSLSEGYIKYPVVTVSIVKSLSRKIYVYGYVNLRGVVQYEENMTVLMALSIVGGVSQEGLYGNLRIKRKQKEQSVDYKDILETKFNDGLLDKKEVENTLLKPDDILIVERSNSYLIQGAVVQPGRHMLEKGLNLKKALLLAGGVTVDGLHGIVKLIRAKGGSADGNIKPISTILNNGIIEDEEIGETLLKADDMIIVERNKTFLIQGEVLTRGRAVLEKDMTVLRAILQSGGTTKEGLFGIVKLRRKQNGKTDNYTDIAQSNLNEGAIEKKEIENLLLQPDDILVIDKNKTFFIYGEVVQTGEFVLRDDMTVFKALTIAGGLTKFGSKNRIKILRTNVEKTGFDTIKINLDDVIEGDATADVKLEPGDIIVAYGGIF